MSKEFSQQQAQQQKQEAQAASGESKQKRCSHCGAILEEDELFCHECGEKYGGEDRECPICKTRTTSDFCPHCGYKITALVCPKCGAESHYDFCENCGTVLNASLAAALEKPREKEAQAVMTEERAAEIKKSFEKADTQELRSFLQKIEEHKILLEERDYFKNREKRVVKVLGANPFEITLPDPEEEAFKMKAYASLEKTVIEREEKATKEMLEKMFPTYEKDMAEAEEAERLKAEAERKAREKAEAERKRKAAEQRKRKLEQERKRAEQAALQNRFLGKYVLSDGSGYISIDRRDGNNIYGTVRYDKDDGEWFFTEYEGTLHGDEIDFHDTEYTMSPNYGSVYTEFTGSINLSGTAFFTDSADKPRG